MKRTNLIRPHRLLRRSPFDKNGISQLFRQHYATILMAIFLLAGVAFGAVYIGHGNSAFLQKLDFLFFSNFKERAMRPATVIFAASLASSFLFVFACFLCGLSMWGMLFVPVILVFRGFGVGITAGHLIASYGLKGFLFYLLVILPGAFFCFWGLILAAQEGIRFSKKIICQDSIQIKCYFMRFGMILVIEFLAALLDALTAVCFSGFFSF